MWRRIREEGDKQNDTNTTRQGEQIAEAGGSIDFGPIDAFHLADLSILRGRITKLLLNSPDHTHVIKDLIITLVSLPNFVSVSYSWSQRDSKIRPKQNVVSSAPG